MIFEWQPEDEMEAIAILAIAIVVGEKIDNYSIVRAVNLLHSSGRNTSEICDRLQYMGNQLAFAKSNPKWPGEEG